MTPATTALLIVDVQNDFVADRGRVGRDGADLRPLQAAVAHINSLVDAARERGGPIVYIRTEHGPDVDAAPYQARYERRGMTPEDTLCRAGTWGAELFSDLRAPGPDDAVIVKHGYDAFAAPRLGEVLNARGVRTVVVTGVVADLCVRATAFSAFEHGFFTIVPQQTTAAIDDAARSRALADIAAWYGETPPVEEVIAAWRVRADG